MLSILVTHSQSNQTKYELLDSNRLSINHSRRSSPPSKTSEFAIEGDLPRLLTIGLHEAPSSNILWTVSLSYLVSEPAVGPRGRLPGPEKHSDEATDRDGAHDGRSLESRPTPSARSCDNPPQKSPTAEGVCDEGSFGQWQPQGKRQHRPRTRRDCRAAQREGIETQVFQLGAKPIRDCIGCGQCGKLDCRCTFDDDMVNELIAAAEQADGFVFGSPVYYAHPSGRILSALDRAFYAGSKAFAHKPGAAVAVARRGGTSTTFDVLNKYFTINQMPVVASTYWNNVFGAMPGEAARTPKALPPCETSAKTWPGSYVASRRERPPASKPPRPIALGPTLFGRTAEHKYERANLRHQKVLRYQEGPALF